MKNFKAALFDLDGTLFDTEPQYSRFWGNIARTYHPDIPGLENKIKGTTLDHILDTYFKDEKLRHTIVSQLDEFEKNMEFPFVNGVENFICDLKNHNVKCAVVTSSNQKKLTSLLAKIPRFEAMFDKVLTSEMFDESKPSPDCYLKAAEAFGIPTTDCVVFEDAFNGLKAGVSAGMFTVGVATTNKPEDIRPLCDFVIADFSQVNFEAINRLLSQHHI